MQSFADIPTELPCLGDLEYSVKLPVQNVSYPNIRSLTKKCSKFVSSR